jgi:prefoldin subunit 5
MQTMAWTDERLEERFDRIDDRFEEVNRRLIALEEAMVELRQRMDALQASMNRGNLMVFLALLGVIGAILAKGG